MKSLKLKKINFKIPHALTLLFIVIVFFGILSLILSYSGITTEKLEEKDGVYVEKAVSINGAGILEWFAVIPMGIYGSLWVLVFLFTFGSFVYVVLQTHALNAVIFKILGKLKYHKSPMPIKIKKYSLGYYWINFKNAIKENWIIIPLMLFFSLNGTFNGMGTSSLPYYAFIIPVVLAAGFDVWTGFLIIFIGAGSGVMGSTVNPFSSAIAADSANAGIHGYLGTLPDAENSVRYVSLIDGIGYRFFAWILLLFFSIGFTIWYANLVKNKPEKSYFFDSKETDKKFFLSNFKLDEKTEVLTKRKLIISIFFLGVFIVMLFFIIPYDSILDANPMKELEDVTFSNNKNISWFHNSGVSSAMKRSGQSISWKLGNFNMTALSVYFIIASIIVTLINKTEEKVFIEDITHGFKNMIPAILCIGMASGISVLLDATNLQLLFIQGIRSAITPTAIGNEVANKDNNAVIISFLTYIVTIPISLLIPSTSGLARGIFPVLGPAVSTVKNSDGTVELLEESTYKLNLTSAIGGYVWGIGLGNLFAPTYAAVICSTQFCRISYGSFLKAIWKYLLIMFTLGIFLIFFGGATGWIAY